MIDKRKLILKEDKNHFEEICKDMSYCTMSLEAKQKILTQHLSENSIEGNNKNLKFE